MPQCTPPSCLLDHPTHSSLAFPHHALSTAQPEMAKLVSLLLQGQEGVGFGGMATVTVTLYSLVGCKVGVGHTCYECDTLLNGWAPFVGV